MKRILCFGDSNTWGYDPAHNDRYGSDQRWTGVCAQLLGTEYQILEDGINGRTSVFQDPNVDCRCGKDALGYALMAQKPLDGVILSLGTNDLKYTDARGSARGMEEILRRIVNANQIYESYTGLIFKEKPYILLVSPVLIREEIRQRIPEDLLANRAEESRNFARNFERIARKWSVDYLNAADFAEASLLDCVHMTPQSHAKLGSAVAAKVREHFDHRENA